MVFIVSDALEFSCNNLFTIIYTLLEAEMKLTYITHLKAFPLSLGYVISLKYKCMLSHKLLHMM